MSQNDNYNGLSYVTVPIQWISETEDGNSITHNILLKKLSDGRLVLDTNEVEYLNNSELVLETDDQCQFTEISPEQEETDNINAAFYGNTIEFINEDDIQIESFPAIDISQVEIVSSNNELFASEHWKELKTLEKSTESEANTKENEHINKSYSIVEGKPGVRYLRCKKTSELKGPGRPRRDGVIPPRKERVGPFKCQYCDLDYNIYALLRKHEKQHTDFKAHQCPKCPISFNLMSNYVLHAATHTPGVPKCPVCSKTFARHASLKAHLNLHFVEDNPICTNCSSMFHTQAQYDLHKKTCSIDQTTVTKEKPKVFVKPKRKAKTEKFQHSCSTCSKAFQKPSQLERHVRIHTGEKPYKCKICSRGFNQKGSMKIHMASHSGIRPYACPLCPAKFSQKGNLQAHWSLHPNTSRSLSNYLSRKDGNFPVKPNNETTTDGFPCNKCSCVFRKLSSLNAHNGRAHSEVKSSLEFNINSVMSDLAELQNAASVNKDILQEALSNSGLDKKNDNFSNDKSPETQSKNYGNNSANVVSSDITVFENSMSGIMRGFTIKQRKIGNVKWHQCSFCGKEFKKPSDLIRHLRIHTKEKPYECQQCHRSFTVKSTLTAHIKTHMGSKAKRHTCPVCLKTFAATSSLSVHVRLHTGVKPHLCQYCDKAFRTAGLLRTHKYAHCSKKPSQTNDPEFTVMHMEEPIIITKNGFVQPQSKLAEVYAGSSISRPHACTHCPAAYRKMSHLKQHMAVHTGERPFNCDICKRSFHNVSMLKSHIHTHSGLRPFKCIQCDSVFSTAGSLKRHSASHSEQRNYMCPYCHKTFKTKVNCRRHMKTHRLEINNQLQSSMGLDQNNIIVTSVVPTNIQITPENILPSTYEEQTDETDPITTSENIQIIHSHQILNLDQANLEIIQAPSNHELDQTDNTNNLILNVNLSEINQQNNNLNVNQNLLQTNNLNQNLIIQNLNNINQSQIVNTNNINLNSEVIQNNNILTINNSTNQPIINNSNMLENVINLNSNLLNLQNDYILNTNNIKLIRDNTVVLNNSVENVILPDNILDNSLPQNIENINFENGNLLLENSLQSTKGLLTLVTKENGQHIILGPNILLQNQNSLQSDDNEHEISANVITEQITEESLKQQILSIMNEQYPNTNKFQFINSDDKIIDPKLIIHENENKDINTYLQKVVNNWPRNVAFEDSQEASENRQIEIDLTNQFSENSVASDMCHNESALEKSNASVLQSIEDIWTQNEAINATNMAKILPVKTSNFNKEKNCSNIVVNEAEENDADMLIMADGIPSMGIEYADQELSEKSSDFLPTALHNISEQSNFKICKTNVNNAYSEITLLENNKAPSKNMASNENLKNDELNKIINTKPFSISMSEKAFLESVDKKTRGKEVDTIVKHANQCETCPKSFRKPSDLIRHIRTHTGERPFVCKICRKAFAVKSSLDTHMLTHSGIKQWKCHVCNSNLATRGSLKLHMRLHTGLKPFSCPLCDATFRTSGHKTAHLLVHYREAKREGKDPADIITRKNKNKDFISFFVQQLENNEITPTENTETTSERNNMLNEVKHIICDNNGTDYFERNNDNTLPNESNVLPINESGTKHISIRIIPENSATANDDGNKIDSDQFNIPLQINLADIKITNFDQLGQFLIQPQTETGENDVPDIQVDEFEQTSHCIKREKVQHVCEECGKNFSKPFQLVRHKRIHSGEKPFACNICSKAFNQKNSLDTHMRHHTGERPHPCPFCSHSFTQKGNLKTHLNRNHAIEQSRAAMIEKLKIKQYENDKLCQNTTSDLDSMVSPLPEFMH